VRIEPILVELLAFRFGIHRKFLPASIIRACPKLI
jgi:hypothetical protein